MKSFFSIVGLIAIMGGIVCLTSCKKDEKSCKCKYVEEGRTYIADVYPINHQAKDCKQLGTILTAESGGWNDESITYTCK
jgi:hypothetical protein